VLHSREVRIRAVRAYCCDRGANGRILCIKCFHESCSLSKYKFAANTSSSSIIHQLRSSIISVTTLPNNRLKPASNDHNMQFYSIMTALCLLSTALACANGPYKQGADCLATCDGAHRCGDDNWIVSRLYYIQLIIRGCECKLDKC
jgi:hypothetical protein